MIGYIYTITNKLTQEVYVGQTIDITKRWNDHKNKLSKNCHVNKKLQKAWNLYGSENFNFNYTEYEINEPSQLNDLEIDTISKYDSYNNGYNLTLGGEGGNTRGKLSFENYCFIYIGCRWAGMTNKISKFLQIDSSTVSAILREKSYLWYKQEADDLTDNKKAEIINNFRKTFNIPANRPYDEIRTNTSLTEDDYFYSLCIASTYSRGIETALSKFFNRHKSFLSNGVKNKVKGVAFNALQKYKNLSEEEIMRIGKEKFEEWNIQNYTNSQLFIKFNNKWR